MSEHKFCKDCKFFDYGKDEWDEPTWFGFGKPRKCRRIRENCLSNFHPVTGAPIVTWAIYARNEGHCGRSARFFEPLPTTTGE